MIQIKFGSDSRQKVELVPSKRHFKTRHVIDFFIQMLKGSQLSRTFVNLRKPIVTQMEKLTKVRDDKC